MSGEGIDGGRRPTLHVCLLYVYVCLYHLGIFYNFKKGCQLDAKKLQALQDMHKLQQTDPAKLRELLLANPHIVELLTELNDKYSASKEVTVKGFCTFYKSVYLRELPEAAVPIADAFVWAFHNKKGAIEECWRGFGKSTFLTAWGAYIVGARPVGSTALVRINDKAAQKTGGAIAEMIETNPGWKEIFPHVVPDKEAGWSLENGFHVKDTRVVEKDGYDKWLQLCFADHVAEPSLACGGIESGIIIGMHPSNGMWIDDLHDEGNTRSRAEMDEIIAIMQGNIISTWFGMGGSPAVGVACTPWSENDAYAVMMKTGLFRKISIPIFVRADAVDTEHPCYELWQKNKAEHTVYFAPYGYDVILTAPKEFPVEKCVEMYNANPTRFGQMYLLDLNTLKGLTLLREWLNEYPSEKIMETWPCYFAIDFASTTDKLKQGDTDYFALAIGRAIPGGGVVVQSGFRARLKTHEALAKVEALASMYHPVAIGVERWGKGEEFKNQLVYSTLLPILPLPLQGAPVRSKGQRFETGLAYWFSNGRMWINSVKDDFLKSFEDEWVSWDGGNQKSRTGHDDTLDSVYWLGEISLGQVMQGQRAERDEARKKRSNPLAGIGSYRGYG